MNENIRRIGRECKLYVEDTLPSGWPNENLIVLETLAQEVAKECARIVTDAVDRREPASTYADKIKQHFGLSDQPPPMKPCPFCGHQMDMDNPDTVYPNGTGWKIGEDGIRTYHDAREVPREQWCYSVHCVGCGVEVSGDSRQECLDKWHRRA